MSAALPAAPGIYLIRNTINGKVYVGQSKNIARRWKEHRSAGRDTHLKRAIKKYGVTAFEVVALELVDDEVERDLREQFWLDASGAGNSDVCYNIRTTATTNHGVRMSEETKVKISTAKKGRKRGPLGAEWRKRIGDACRGKTPPPRSAEYRAAASARASVPVEQIDPATAVVVAIWGSITKAAAVTGVCRTSISACCAGKQCSAGGFMWRRAGDCSQREPSVVGRRAPKSASHRAKIGDGNRRAWARRRKAGTDRWYRQEAADG